MTEVRCPFCGNPNAADARTCTVCGSRLQAVQSESAAEANGPDETPEWLANLRRRAQSETSETESAPAFTSTNGLDEDDSNDWLQSLKQAAAEINSDVFSEPIEPGPFETPGPVKESPAVSPFVAGPDRSDDQSWLRELADLPSEGLENFDSEEDDQAPFAGPVDWARRLASEPIAQQQPAGEPDEPDDLPGAEENGELLSRLQSWTSQPPPMDSTQAKSGADLPTPTPAFTFDEEEPAVAEPESETEEPLLDVDWLQDTAVDEQPAAIPFLESADAEEPAETAAETPAEPDFGPSELPDWIQDLSVFEPAPAESEAEQPPFEMSAVEPAPPEEPEDLPPIEPGDTAAAVPDDESPQPETEVFEDDVDESLFESTPFALDEVPDWLADYSPDDEEVLPEAAGEVDEIEQPIPFARFDPVELAGTTEPQAAEPSPETGEPAESTPEETADEPVPAQLPGWVEAMRPVESVLPMEEVKPESDQRIERSGPLAGIPGAIPGEDLATRYFKPPVYTSKLQVTEKQRLHANLLETMKAETD